MARVASCPQCDHELEIPSEAQGDAWAKCPSCSAYFQIQQATTRSVPSAVLVDESELDGPQLLKGDTIEINALPKLGDLDHLSEPTEKPATFEDLTVDDLDLELDTPTEKPKRADELEATAQRIDEWFRSAKTVPDMPAVTDEETTSESDELDELVSEIESEITNDDFSTIGSPRANATIDLDADRMDELTGLADFDLDDPASFAPTSEQTENEELGQPIASIGAWDDSERMADLLNDIEPPSDEQFVAAVTRDEETMELEPPVAITERPTIQTFDDEAPEVSSVNSKTKRRERSLVRSLMMVTAAGLLGLAAGYYVLLWLRGPSMDFLQVAQYLPSATLPSSFQNTNRFVQVSPPIVPQSDTVASTEPAESEETLDEPSEPQALEPATEELAQAMSPETSDEPANNEPGMEPESAEVQASYTESNEASQTNASTADASDPTVTVGDRYATTTPAKEASDLEPLAVEEEDIAVTESMPAETSEPATESSAAEIQTAAKLTEEPLFDLEETATEAELTLAEPVKVDGAPNFTDADLSTAIENAKKAQHQLVEGNFADGKDVQRAKGYAFSILADLAQKTVFSGDDSANASGQKKEADELFRSTLANSHTREEVAQIVPKWLASPNRKHGGVFFGGKVASHNSAGSVVECQVELDNGERLTVVAPAAIAASIDEAKPVAVVGYVIDSPKNVEGYTGSANQVIYTDALLPL